MKNKIWTRPTITQITSNTVKSGNTTDQFRGEFYYQLAGGGCTGVTGTCVVPTASYSTGIVSSVAFCSFGSAAGNVAICS